MALFLVQHGKSLPKDVDPDRGLSEEGISDAGRIASVAKGYNIHVSGIKHSGKKRALQTAEIFATALEPQSGVQEISGINPSDDVEAFSETITSSDNIMYVGHLPFMEKLTSFLAAGSTEKTVFKFQNSGIVCLDQDPETLSWFIKWSLMPEIG
ncbi:MAG: phosphohistidine phosphatase SixA [Desulfobacteraceae bacterium]|nr:phosphohistidine phosphatase SixA [Desulfobacteraceae bacterium]